MTAADANKVEANSHVGPRWTHPGGGGIATYLETPANVMAASEAYFLRAEGALRGWTMGGTPQELYEAGITNSRSEEHTSELQSPCNLVGHLVISYAVFCLKKKNSSESK